MHSLFVVITVGSMFEEMRKCVSMSQVQILSRYEDYSSYLIYYISGPPSLREFI